MLNVARVTDLVLFPSCGPIPIAEGSPMYYINGLQNARITDLIECGGPLITGSSTFLDQSHPVSRLTDLGVCPGCGVGVVITGAPQDFET